MALSFEIQRVTASERSERGVFDKVDCRVLDDEYNGVDVVFRFSVATYDDDRREVGLRSTKIGQAWVRPGRPHVKRFTISIIRDLPLTRWEQAARGVVAWAIDDLAEWDDPGGRFAIQLTPRNGQASPREDQIDELLKSVHPNLEDDGTPSRRRKIASLRKLASVAIDYRNELMHGRPDPAAAIASKYYTSPSTARSWVHRARAAGLLAPAIGRMAGEQVGPYVQASHMGTASVAPIDDVDNLVVLPAGEHEKFRPVDEPKDIDVAALIRERDEARAVAQDLIMEIRHLRKKLEEARERLPVKVIPRPSTEEESISNAAG